jgi:ADP-ribose pyrophosphatase
MEHKIRTLGTLAARHFTVQLDEVALRTGKTSERIRIDHPEAAAVLAFLDPRHILMASRRNRL